MVGTGRAGTGRPTGAGATSSRSSTAKVGSGICPVSRVGPDPGVALPGRSKSARGGTLGITGLWRPARRPAGSTGSGCGAGGNRTSCRPNNNVRIRSRSPIQRLLRPLHSRECSRWATPHPYPSLGALGGSGRLCISTLCPAPGKAGPMACPSGRKPIGPVRRTACPVRTSLQSVQNRTAQHVIQDSSCEVFSASRKATPWGRHPILPSAPRFNQPNHRPSPALLGITA